MKYKVTFEFLNSEGNWVKDSLSDNGKGYSLSDAKQVADQIRISSFMDVRNIKVGRCKRR